MTLSDRIAELRRIADAIVAGAAEDWPLGIIDGALKRLDAVHDALLMTDNELREISRRYRGLVSHPGAITRTVLVIELARRSTLSAHERVREAAERLRMREAG